MNPADLVRFKYVAVPLLLFILFFIVISSLSTHIRCHWRELFRDCDLFSWESTYVFVRSFRPIRFYAVLQFDTVCSKLKYRVTQ